MSSGAIALEIMMSEGWTYPIQEPEFWIQEPDSWSQELFQLWMILSRSSAHLSRATRLSSEGTRSNQNSKISCRMHACSAYALPGKYLLFAPILSPHVPNLLSTGKRKCSFKINDMVEIFRFITLTIILDVGCRLRTEQHLSSRQFVSVSSCPVKTSPPVQQCR